MGNWTSVRDCEFTTLTSDKTKHNLRTLQEDFRFFAADACMFGYMTADLSQSIRRALSWADLSSYPIKINWDDLPQPSKPRVPFFPWMFGYAPNYVRGYCQWWEEPSKPKNKPSWWDDPDQSVSDYLKFAFRKISNPHSEMAS